MSAPYIIAVDTDHRDDRAARRAAAKVAHVFAHVDPLAVVTVERDGAPLPEPEPPPERTIYQNPNPEA